MNKIEFGDNREIIKRWKNEGIKVQTCITSPPYYGLRSYLKSDDPNKVNEIGLEQTPEEYINNMVEVFRCVRDILNDDGTLWINIGDSYSDKKENNIKPKDLIGIPWMLAFALRNDGWYIRQEIIWQKLTPLPESVTDRCTKSHEQIFLLTKSPNYYFDYESIMEESLSKSSKKPQKIGGNKYNVNGDNADPNVTHANHSGVWDGGEGKRRKRSVWTLGPEPYGKGHFAAFPTEIPRICINAGSKVGDIVLDPFMGSGTTAQVAIETGRQYLGCELNLDYKVFQDERINNELSKPKIIVQNDKTFCDGLFKID